MIDFLVNFQEKSDEIYSKVFNNEIENQDSQKINFKRYLSSEFEQKTETDDTHFLSNNGKKPGINFSHSKKTWFRNLQRWVTTPEQPEQNGVYSEMF